MLYPPLPSGHLEEVQGLVERANKDVAIEALLNTFEEVWLSRQLELRVYKRSSDSSQQEVSRKLCVLCPVESLHNTGPLKYT